jgi:hypothetical protein
MTRLERTLFTVGLYTVVILAVGGLVVGHYVYRGFSSARAFQLDAEAARRGFMAAGATTEYSQSALAKDPRFAAMARNGDFAAIAREFGAHQPPVQAASVP